METPGNKYLQYTISQLISLYKAGDKQAFDEITRRNTGLLRTWMCEWEVKHRQQEEIVQEILIKVSQQLLTNYNENNAFYGWLKRVSKNHTINYLRSTGKLTFVDIDLQNCKELVHDSSTEIIERKKLCEEALNVLETMKEADKNIIKDHFFEKMTYRELAEKYGCKLSAAVKRVERAILRLRKKMKELGFISD